MISAAKLIVLVVAAVIFVAVGILILAVYLDYRAKKPMTVAETFELEDFERNVRLGLARVLDEQSRDGQRPTEMAIILEVSERPVSHVSV